MKNRYLKTFIFLSGLLCLYGFLAIRILPLFNLVSTEKIEPGYWDNTKYGELYYFNNIKHFREELPPPLPKYQFSEKHPKLEQAKVLTFGDSYMDWSRHEQLSSRLNDSLGIPVYFHYGEFPARYLKINDYQNTEPKVLLYTRTERWIPITFGENPLANIHEFMPDNPQNSSAVKNIARSIKDFLFYERSDELYQALLQRNYITSFFTTLISTLKFDLFGYISPLTPVYIIEDDRPWLFYQDQVNHTKTSFYYSFTDEEIEEIATNIKKLSDYLWATYRLKFIFLPVPSKYTIYHYKVNPQSKYNEFLPRLYEKMNKKDITYINLYKLYRKTDQYIFYGTDDHWTETGVQVTTTETLKKIKQEPIYRSNLITKNPK